MNGKCRAAGSCHWDAGSDDPRWLPLHLLLEEIHRRYERPLFIAETSHYGIGRAPWLTRSQRKCSMLWSAACRWRRLSLPVLDRYDWENSRHWHNCGLWDMKSRHEASTGAY